MNAAMRGDYPQNPLELAQRTLALSGRVGATRIYTAPRLATALTVSGGAAPTAQVQIQFFRPAIVLGLYGQELAGTTAKFASTEVGIRIGNEAFITDGQAETTAPLLALFGPSVNWFPINRQAQPGVNWTITWVNRDAAATATPFLALSVIEAPQRPTR